MLGEVDQGQTIAQLDLTGVRRLRAAKQAHQSRLAGTIGSDQGDALSSLHSHRDVLENDALAVGLADALGGHHFAAAVQSRHKVQTDRLLLFIGSVHHFALLDQLQARLHAGGQGGLVAEALDELHFLLEALLLVLVNAHLLFKAAG